MKTQTCCLRRHFVRDLCPLWGVVIAASLGVPGCAHVEPLGQDLLVVSNGKKNYYLYFSRNCRDGTFINGLRDMDTIQEFHSVVMLALGRKHCLSIEMEFDSSANSSDGCENNTTDSASTADTFGLDGGGTKATLAIAAVDKSHFPDVISQLIEDVFSKVPGLKILNFPGLRIDCGNSEDPSYMEDAYIPLLANNPSLQQLEIENVNLDPDKQGYIGALPIALKFKTCKFEEGGARLLFAGDGSWKKKIHIEGVKLGLDLRLLVKAVVENRIAKLRLEHKVNGFVVVEKDLDLLLELCRNARANGIAIGWGRDDDDSKPFKLMLNYNNLGIVGTRKLVDSTLAVVRIVRWWFFQSLLDI
jgi:hypothetical protein